MIVFHEITFRSKKNLVATDSSHIPVSKINCSFIVTEEITQIIPFSDSFSV